MKIQSKFRDYYDFVGHLNGYDADPKAVIYKRNPQVYPRTMYDEVGQLQTHLLRGVDVLENCSPTYGNSRVKYPLFYDNLVICGHLYHLVTYYEWEHDTIKPHTTIISEKDIPKIWDRIVVYNRVTGGKKLPPHISLRFTSAINRIIETNGEHDDHAVRLSKLLNQPVFCVCDIGYLWSNPEFKLERIPQLGELGVGSVYTPEQLYQTIDAFFINVLRDNPDTAPVSIVPDKAKITNHGFDSKISFRHRK